MRQIMELESGDHVEYMAFSWVIEDVQRIPEADPAVEDVSSPLVSADDVWLTIKGQEPHRANGRLEVPVVGCDGCGRRHKPENCRRRSV